MSNRKESYAKEISQPRPRKKCEQHWLSKALLLLGLKTIGKKLNAKVSYFSPFLSIFTICCNPAIAHAAMK